MCGAVSREAVKSVVVVSVSLQCKDTPDESQGMGSEHPVKQTLSILNTARKGRVLQASGKGPGI